MPERKKPACELDDKQRGELLAISKNVPEIGEDVTESYAALVRLAIELNKRKHYRAAGAISRFLLGDAKSLNHAFGLVRGRGRNKGEATLARDITVLELHAAGYDCLDISDETGMDLLDVEGLVKPSEKFRSRYKRAWSAIVREEARKNDPLDD